MADELKKSHFQRLSADYANQIDGLDAEIELCNRDISSLTAQLGAKQEAVDQLLAERNSLEEIFQYVHRRIAELSGTPVDMAIAIANNEGEQTQPETGELPAVPASNGKPKPKAGRRPPRPRIKSEELIKEEQPEDDAHPGESEAKTVHPEPVMLNSDSQVRSLLLRLINLESPQSLERLLEATYGEDWGSKKISVGRKSGDGAAKQRVITLAEDIIDIRTSVLARRIQSELDKIAKVSGDTEGKYTAGKTLQNEVEQLSPYMDQILAWLGQYGGFPG